MESDYLLPHTEPVVVFSASIKVAIAIGAGDYISISYRGAAE